MSAFAGDSRDDDRSALGRRVRTVFDRILEHEPESRSEEIDHLADRGEISIEVADEVRSLLAFVEATRIDDVEPTPTDHPSALIGCRLGDFRILRLLGIGGTSAVFEAQQERPSRRVAVKVLRSSISGSRSHRRFVQEIEIAGRIDDPAVARVLGSGSLEVEGRETPWLAMEFVTDAASITRHAERADLNLRDRVRLVRDAISGIAAAHRRGVIHRDIKPGNVLVDGSGSVKVIDFGIARLLDDQRLVGVMTATLPGQVVGTVPFMAPEQLSGDAGAVDVRTDVYALGITLHLLLSGRMPYEVAGCDFLEAARRIREVEVDSIRRFASDVDRDLDGIVQKSLAKDPESRYQSVDAFDADLEAWLEGRPVTARPLGNLGRTWRVVRRYPISTALACATFAVIVGATITLSLMLARESTLRATADRSAAQAGIAAASRARQEGDLGAAARYLASVPETERGWEYDWLSGLIRHEDVVHEHPRGDMISVDLAPATEDREALVVATGYRGSWAYGLEDHRRRWWLREVNPGGFWKHLLLPGGRRMVVCDLHPALRVVDIATGLPLFEHETPGPIGAMAPIDDERIVVGGDDGRLHVMNLSDGSMRATVDPGLGGITSLLALRDGRFLVGTSKGSLLETNADLDPVRSVREFAEMIPRLRTDESEERIAVCTHGDLVEIVDAANFETIMRLDDHLADVWDARFDDRRDRLVTASLDESIRVFDLTTGRTLERRSGASGYIWSMALERDGLHAWIGCHDGTLRRVALERSSIEVPGGTAGRGVAWSPDGGELAVSTATAIHVFDPTERSWGRSIAVETEPGTIPSKTDSLAWCGDSIWFGSGRGVGLWRFDADLEDGVPIRIDRSVTDIEPIQGGGVFVSFEDGSIARYDDRGGERARTRLEWVACDIETHPAGHLYVVRQGRNNDGAILAAASLDSIGTFDGFGQGSIFDISFSPDGEFGVSGGRERPMNVVFFSTVSPRSPGRVGRIGHASDVRLVEFFDSGRRVVTAGDDGRVMVARPSDPAPLLTIFESRDAIKGLDVSPDGRSIAATGGTTLFLAQP